MLTYIQVSRSTPPVRKVTYRKLKSVNIVDFQQDILDSGIHLDSEMSLNGFVSLYNSTLHDCLEKHAPILPGLSLYVLMLRGLAKRSNVLKERKGKRRGNGE